mmetsp:Transcript_11962/g.38056  ORF Transcript_11962/g.38056 Transcript_11962/m.38056 type:complete len:138 (-) Transcript_11962:341-754(-)
MDEQFALALAYQKKFHNAPSATHERWLHFFARSLSRQVAAVAESIENGPEPPEVSMARNRYTALFLARVTALNLHRAAVAAERTQRNLLATLRTKFYHPATDLDRTRRAKVAHVDSCLGWLVSAADERVFGLVLSFL